VHARSSRSFKAPTKAAIVIQVTFMRVVPTNMSSAGLNNKQLKSRFKMYVNPYSPNICKLGKQIAAWSIQNALK